jgi:hypothetical protein
MFHRTIVNGKKGPAYFWEKEYRTINSTKHDRYILTRIQGFFKARGDRPTSEESFIFMQDNAPSHRSEETIKNLRRQRIPTVKFPPYSPDLNLVKHI